MIIINCDQNSQEWFDSRLGVQTGSKFKDVLAKGAGKTRKSYMYQLAAEIITGEREESYSNSFMEWGTENEPSAVAMYELEANTDTQEVGFILREDKLAGVSPDRLVGDNGLLEIKCPKTTTQIETVLSGKMPTSHKSQVQGQLWVAEREWCDFVSYDPRINGDAMFFCERQYRDEDYINNLHESCRIFKNELDEIISALGH